MGSIYKITNTVNGKVYIGQTRHDAEKTRIRDHLTGKGSRIIKSAIEKYGKDAFTYQILHDDIIPEFLDTLEIEAIEKFNTVSPNGYNLRAGGGGGSPSEETRRKLSDINKGKTISKETRRKISEAGKGRKVSKQTRRKLSEANTGKKHSEETRRKISKAGKGRTPPNKGKPMSEEQRRKISHVKTGKPASNKGKPMSEEQRRKIAHALKGRTLPEETRRKLSEAKKGKPPNNRSQYYDPAHKFFCTLPKTLSLSEKFRKLRERFPNVSYNTTYNWVRKWGSRKLESNIGRICLTETRRKISKANRGQKRSEAARRNMSKAMQSPERIAARKFFFSLPADMDLKDKRKHLRQRFPNNPRQTIYQWCKKFDSEA